MAFMGETMPRHQHILMRTSCTLILALMIFCYFPSVSFSASKAHIPEKIPAPFLFLENSEEQIPIHRLLVKKKKMELENRKDLSPEEREFLEEKHKEWKSLSPEEKKIIRKRLNKWKKMSPKERELYQRRFEQWQHLTPKERKKLQEDLDQWEHLPPQKQDAIRHQFKN